MSPTIYMIRSAEKPPANAEGLSVEGLERAQYLPRVFGEQSEYNIGYIIAERPQRDGSRARPSETVAPLAARLGVVVDTSFSSDDTADAAAAAKRYTGDGNVLVCWESTELAKIAKSLGVRKYAPSTGHKGAVEYPGDRFDIIWVIPPPFDEITEVKSEDVPGLDD